MTGQLERLLNDGTFVVTAELTPPLAADRSIVQQRARPLKGLADAVNVTDAAGARAAMSSFAAAAILVQEGLEPVLQVTCRDRNRIALASDLIGASALGIHNLLILFGDDPKVGDQPEAKAVHDLDSRGLMSLAQEMRDKGTLPSGRAIVPPPHLFIGGADTPFDPPPEWAPTGLESKAEAGADFVQTQFCFDLEVAQRYFGRLRDAGLTDRLKVIAGIGPIASAKSARWMDENLHGVTVPPAIIQRLEAAQDQPAEGRRICIELMQGLREIPGLAGVHVMAPQQKIEVIGQVIEESGLIAERAA